MQEMVSDLASFELMCQLPRWGSPCILSAQYLMLGDNKPVLSKSWELLRTEVFVDSLEMPAECTLEPGWRAILIQACLLLLSSCLGSCKCQQSSGEFSIEPSSPSWFAVHRLQWKTCSIHWPCHHGFPILWNRS